MSGFERPMVGLSLTEPDDGLLRYAARATELFGWTDVHFAHVVSSDGSRKWDQNLWETGMKVRVEEHFSPSLPHVHVSCHTVHGSRLDQLLAVATNHDRDLIMLGHRKMRSGRRSLARRLAMISPATVWLVPEGSPAKISRILVPTDFSEPSADAMKVAVQVAAQSGVPSIQAVHVYFDTSTIRYDEHIDAVLGKEEELFERHLDDIELQGIDVQPTFLESTHPSQAILQFAERSGTDLIVMNTRGRSQAALVLLGSTTSEVMSRATVPVLAVKHYGSHMNFVQALYKHSLRREDSPKTN